MEIGETLGLAQSFQADARLNDLRYQNHQMKQAQAEAVAKAKMFADDLNFQNAANPYDNGIIKNYSNSVIKQIGAYVRENPDWQINPDKLVQINLMKRELKDNPHLLRGLASDTSFKQLNADLAEVAKNPEQHDQEAYQELLAQKENYLKYGNQFGLEDFNKRGAQPFVYTKPKDFVNLPKALMELGSNIKNYNVVKGKNIGEYWTEPKPEDVQNANMAALQEHRRQIMVEARKNGITDPNEIEKWVGSQIASGFQKHYSVGDANAAFENGMRIRDYNLAKAKAEGKELTSPSTTPWDDLFDKRKPSGNIPVDLARKVWNDTPKIEISGINGQKVDLTGQKMNYDGRYITNSHGQRFLTGFVKVPVSLAKQKGIWDDSDASNPGVTSGFLGKATRGIYQDENGKEILDSDGKPQMYVRVDYQMPIDQHDGTGRQIYNTQAQPDKLVAPLSPDNLQGNKSAKTFVDEVGNIFDANGKYLGKQ